MAEPVTRKDLSIAIDGLRREIENQTFRITIRMGVMLTAGPFDPGRDPATSLARAGAQRAEKFADLVR